MSVSHTEQIFFEAGNTVGIDLGATFSAIAQVSDAGEPIPIPNEDDEEETASLILLTDSKNMIVGPPQREEFRRGMGEFVHDVADYRNYDNVIGFSCRSNRESAATGRDS